MSDKIEVKKIVLRIGKKEIELAPEDVKELRDKLTELLGEPKTVTINYPSWPWYVYPNYGTTWTVTSGDLWTSTSGNLTLSNL